MDLFIRSLASESNPSTRLEGWLSDRREFLELIAREYMDPQMYKLTRWAPNQLQSILAAIHNHGHLTDAEFKRLRQEIQDGDLSCSHQVERFMIRAKQAHALSLMSSAEFGSALDVLVETAWTTELNASSQLGLSGRPTILLDLGMTMWTETVCQSALVLVSAAGGAGEWRSADEALRCIFLYTLTGDFEWLTLSRECLQGSAGFLSREDTQVTVAQMAATMQSFIILHEYGHVQLGHLALPANDRLEQEYAADMYAVTKLLKEPDAPVLWSVSLLMRTFAMIEKVQPAPAVTHPHWGDRWTRLKPLVSESSRASRPDVPSLFEKMFDQVDMRHVEYLRSLIGVL